MVQSYPVVPHSDSGRLARIYVRSERTKRDDVFTFSGHTRSIHTPGALSARETVVIETVALPRLRMLKTRSFLSRCESLLMYPFSKLRLNREFTSIIGRVKTYPVSCLFSVVRHTARRVPGRASTGRHFRVLVCPACPPICRHGTRCRCASKLGNG